MASKVTKEVKRRANKASTDVTSAVAKSAVSLEEEIRTCSDADALQALMSRSKGQLLALGATDEKKGKLFSDLLTLASRRMLDLLWGDTSASRREEWSRQKS